MFLFLIVLCMFGGVNCRLVVDMCKTGKDTLWVSGDIDFIIRPTKIRTLVVPAAAYYVRTFIRA